MDDQKGNGRIKDESEERDEIEENGEIDEIEEEEQEQNEEVRKIAHDSENLKNGGEEKQGKLEKLFITLKTGFSLRPIPTINSTIACLEITGFILLIIGIIILVFSTKVKQVEIRYDDKENCKIGSKCEINFTISKNMEKNVFVYYRLKNFYQNHRRYIKSKSNKQLKGNIMKENEIKDDCDPIILNKDIYLGIKSIGGKPLDPDGVAHPCGLIAKSFFNDSYEIKKIGGNEEIIISATDIAWKVDKEKFKNSENYTDYQWLNVEDERFMVWMRPAAMPDFRKPWGRIERELSEGEYIVTITNNYPVKSFDGKKYFILSTVNGLGGKNYFLSILYIVMGGVSSLVGFLFFFGYNKYDNEKKKQHNF